MTVTQYTIYCLCCLGLTMAKQKAMKQMLGTEQLIVSCIQRVPQT